MLQNYFKVALRNILRHKFYSVLNIAGLAFGLTACFLIGLYIFDELNYDKFHKDYQNIYHIGLHGKIGGRKFSRPLPALRCLQRWLAVFLVWSRQPALIPGKMW